MDRKNSGDRTRSLTGSACSTKDHIPSKNSSGQLLENNAHVNRDTEAKQTEDDESHPSKRVKEKETKEALDSSSEESAEVPNREADKDDVELALEKKQSRILAADPNLVCLCQYCIQRMLT